MNDYQIRQGNKIYVFRACLVKNAVRLYCKTDAGKEYSRDFTFLDINSIDPIFSEIKSEKEAIEFIDKALRVHKVKVSEESGIVKIIFYVTSKGVNNIVEIPLGESPSKKENSNDGNALASTAQAEPTQPVEIPTQTYENTNNLGPVNTYGQYSFYNVPNITPIVEIPNDDSNFNTNNFTSQFKFDGQNYTTTTSYQGDTEFGTTNIENVGSYMVTDNNQFLQSNFATTNGFTDFSGLNSYSGNYTTGNEYNNNAFDFSSGQYTTTNDNNYITSDLSNNYGTTDNYDQYSGMASYNGQEYNTLPTITPADPISSKNPSLNLNTYEGNNYDTQLNTNTYPTTTSYNESQPQTTTNINPNQPLYETQYVSDTAPNDDVPNKNFQKKEEKEKEEGANEENEKKSEKEQPQLQKSSPQRKNSKAQINIDEEEFEKLKAKAEEADVLREQLTELEPLRKELQQIEVLKSQIVELNDLKAQVAEYNSIKEQIGDLNNLREQLNQINELKRQIEELQANKRNGDEEIEKLKKKVELLEKIKIDYEKEIEELRGQNGPSISNNNKPSISNKPSFGHTESKGLENKKILFEEKSKQVCVKGDIIHNTKELEMITRKINKFNKKLTLNLLYKASADTDKATAFHSKCDNAKSTIVLIETDKGKRFGGYTTCNWRGDCIDKKDEDAFVFSFDTMKTYDNIPGEEAIGCYPKFGPIFMGCQIRIYDNAFSKGGTTFERGLNFNTEEDYELTGGERAFNVKEIEVYEVIPQ